MKRKRLKFPNSLKLECVSKKKKQVGLYSFLKYYALFCFVAYKEFRFSRLSLISQSKSVLNVSHIFFSFVTKY